MLLDQYHRPLCKHDVSLQRYEQQKLASYGTAAVDCSVLVLQRCVTSQLQRLKVM